MHDANPPRALGRAQGTDAPYATEDSTTPLT